MIMGCLALKDYRGGETAPAVREGPASMPVAKDQLVDGWWHACTRYPVAACFHGNLSLPRWSNTTVAEVFCRRW